MVFSAVFHRVNHQGILYKLCSVGIGSSVLSIMSPFQSNLSQYVNGGHWTVFLENWLILCEECTQHCFMWVIVPLVYFGAIFLSRE